MVLACALVGLVGCVKANDAVCDGNLVCPDPSRPFCDLDGAIDGTPDTCIAVACTPGEFGACRSDNALMCNTSGDGYDTTACSNGCDVGGCRACVGGASTCSADGNVVTCDDHGVEQTTETCAAGCGLDPAPHCRYIEPVFAPDVCDMGGPDDTLVVSSAVTLDSTQPLTCNGGTIHQASDVDLCIVHYRHIEVTAGGVLKFKQATTVGSPVPAVMLVSDDDFEIAGVVDVGATAANDGAGGGSTSSGSELLISGGNSAGGAGGATTGGRGCRSDGTGIFETSGGGATSAPLVTLHGGAHDADTYRVGMGTGGGGGGGALALVSCHGMLTVSGTITAGGGGGSGFAPCTTSGACLAAPPAGGGAGGTVVLEGLAVNVTGGLFANGGGGGGSAFGGGAAGNRGQDGSSTTTPASGGFGTNQGGEGGGLSAPGDTQGCLTNSSGASGGGGAAGFIDAFAPLGSATLIAPSAASPAVQPVREALLR